MSSAPPTSPAPGPLAHRSPRSARSSPFWWSPGRSATTMCADLGARTIRDELDTAGDGRRPGAPTRRTRVLAATVVADVAGIAGDIRRLVAPSVSVFVGDVTPIALRRRTHPVHRVCPTSCWVWSGRAVRPVGRVDRLLQGHVGAQGPRGVGNAVNETVVCRFIACSSSTSSTRLLRV